MKNSTGKRQFAQSASALGAGILGFGIGAKWGNIVTEYAYLIILAGAVLHVSGMYLTQMKHFTTAGSKAARILWYSAWACLALLIGLVVYMIAD